MSLARHETNRLRKGNARPNRTAKGNGEARRIPVQEVARTIRPRRPVPREGQVYAIAFDLDNESLRKKFGDPHHSAYLEVRRVLQRHGFTCQQGSVYFGDE